MIQGGNKLPPFFMEKRNVNIEGKKEVTQPKKRKRKPIAKKQFYKRTEKKEWFNNNPPNDIGSYD